MAALVPAAGVHFPTITSSRLLPQGGGKREQRVRLAEGNKVTHHVQAAWRPDWIGDN
jgi:hypothetical protein